MLRDSLGHPVDPVERLRGRAGLIPLGGTPDHVRSAHVRSACLFVAAEHGKPLTADRAQHYASALGFLLWVLPFAEQSARQAPPHLREHYNSSDAAANAYALACRVVETADLICRGVDHGQ